MSDKAVRSEPPPSRGNRIVYDAEVKGFGVRITYNGARSFVLNYRNRDGTARRLTIGSYPDWPVANARSEAARLKRIIDQGADPLAEQREQRLAPDVSALAERYVTEHALPHKRPASVRDDKRLIRQWILPELGSRKVEMVEYADIEALHHKITDHGTPTSANRCVALVSKMFSLARRWKWRQGDNPATGIQRNPENRRDRPLSAAETARFLAAVGEYPQRSAADAIMLLALTGARSQEVLKATWSQFDLETGVWNKPSAHTKQKKEHRVPLTAAAVRLLANRPRGERDAYVFPGRRSERPLTDLSRPWQTICARAGIPHGRKSGITPHDLRHSFGTMLGSAGESLPIIGALLGHTQATTTLRYVHMFVDPLRAAAERVATQLNGTADQSDSAPPTERSSNE